MKDNKVNVEGNIALVKKVFDDEAKLKVTTEVANECSSVTDADRCEASFKIMQCFDQAGKARGIDFAEW